MTMEYFISLKYHGLLNEMLNMYLAFSLTIIHNIAYEKLNSFEYQWFP